MNNIIVATDQSSPAFGPFSQAVIKDGFLHASGLMPFLPGSGDLVSNDLEEQVHQCMRNMKAVLAAADMTMEDAGQRNDLHHGYAGVFHHQQDLRFIFQGYGLSEQGGSGHHCFGQRGEGRTGRHCQEISGNCSIGRLVDSSAANPAEVF